MIGKQSATLWTGQFIAAGRSATDKLCGYMLCCAYFTNVKVVVTALSFSCWKYEYVPHPRTFESLAFSLPQVPICVVDIKLGLAADNADCARHP